MATTSPTSLQDVLSPAVMRPGGYTNIYGNVPDGTPTWTNVTGQGQDPLKIMYARPQNFGGDMTNLIGGNGLPLSNYANATGDPMSALGAGWTGSTSFPNYLSQLLNGGMANPTGARGTTGATSMNYGNPGNVLSGLGQPGSLVSQGDNAVPSNLSPEEQLLDRMFFGSATGQGGGPIANQLFNLGMGRLPPAMADWITANNNEQFGHLGSRFGTDLAMANARGLGLAGAQQSQNAIHEILGLGGTTAGFQFNRGENALNRAMQEYIAKQQNDPMNSLLQALLGGG